MENEAKIQQSCVCMARLVVKGFQQKEGIDYQETYGPVAKLTTFKLLLAVSNRHKFILHQMDVKTAFLNGVLQEELYIKVPEGLLANNNQVCKLEKAIYGQKQAPKA